MSHQTVYNPETKIIETKLSDKITPQEIIDIVKEDAQLTLKHKCFLWLNDYSNATEVCDLTNISDFRVINAEMMAALGNDRFKVRRAIAGNIGKKNFEAAQSSSDIKGNTFMICKTIEEARLWLHKE